MRNNITRSDIFDINKKTGGLILGKNRLDDYATKFLSQVCKKALEEPMALPIDEILDHYNLNVEEASLSLNLDIFGCCLLLDGDIKIYNKETGESIKKHYPAGTILIDPDYLERYGEGAKRNTLVHEILHWEKDRQYFKILQLNYRDKSDELSPIMCRQSETFFEPPEGKNTKENEVRWLEWQAHRLAPRVLMPSKTFKQKATEIITELGVDLTCDNLIDTLSDFFQVSRISVKYRLIEVGLSDELMKLADYDSLYAEINSANYMQLTPEDAFSLLQKDKLLANWVSQNRFIFAEGYFTLASPDYIAFKDGVPILTAKAKRNKDKCIINIRESCYVDYKNFCKDYGDVVYLYRSSGVDKRICVFDPKFQGNFDELDPNKSYFAVCQNIKGYDVDEEKELMRLIGDPDKTLCDCLTFLFKSRKWRYSSDFSSATLLHVNYFGDIKNNKRNNMGTDVLIAICVGLKLSLRLTDKLFEKANRKINYYKDPDKTYVRILETFPGISIDDFNGILEQAGIKQLGTKNKKE